MAAASGSLRVLVTNVTLATRSGTEMFVRDLALGLARAGHRPEVYTPDPGPVAEELRAAGVPVTDDLASCAPPDLIHGHHSLPTLAAIARFTGVPALFVVHDRSQWTDAPPRHPRILRWVAVDVACRERLEAAPWIASERVRMIHNAFDPDRFRPRPPLPARPRRALLFSNSASEAVLGGQLREACEAAGVALECVGLAGGNQSARPESLLVDYDLVFAKARCAIEAMATGCAVILCDLGGLGGLVTPADFDGLRARNFGGTTLTRPVGTAEVSREIARYDAEACAEVTRRVRQEATLEQQVGAFVELYREILAEGSPPADAAAEGAAMAEFMASLLPRWSEIWKVTLAPAAAALEARELEQAVPAAAAERAAGLEREIDRLRQACAAAEAGRAELELRMGAAQARLAVRAADRIARLPGVTAVWRRMARRGTSSWPAMPIVVGAPRSGTTLLRMMLDSHSELAVPPETGWLAAAAELGGAAASQPEDGPAALLELILDSPSWPDFHLTRDALAAALGRLQPFTVADGVRAFYRLYAAAHGKPRWGEKTPDYGRQMEPIARLLPEARFVHLIRDGRDVALSVRGLWFAPGDSPEALAADWVARVGAARAAAGRLGSCLEVRYEALVTEPEAVLRRICTHVELRFERDMLDYHLRAAARLAEHEGRTDATGRTLVRREERLAQQRRVSTPPDRSRVGVWRREMPADERRRFESVAGALLAELGYPRD